MEQFAERDLPARTELDTARAGGVGPAARIAAGQSRRRLLLLLVNAGAGTVLLEGCRAQPAGAPREQPAAQPVTISYLRYYTQQDRIEAEQAVFQRLAQQYPGLKVDELTVAGTGEMIQHMTAAYAGGNAPDTWTTAPTIYHEYVQAGKLLQLNDLIKKDIDQKKYFWETMAEWESPAASGRYFGLTRDFVVTILYYNKGMFDAAGVPYPDASWSYETLAQHGSRFARNQDSPEASEWAFLADASHGNWDPAVRANGGQVLNRQRSRAAMDGSQPALETTEQWIAWNQQLRISPPPGHAFYQSYQGLSLRNPFFTGRVAMYQALTGLIPQLHAAQNPLLRWDVTVVPRGKVRREAYGGPDGQVISKESKHPDMAWKIMLAFLEPESLPFHLAWGGIPFSRAITELPAWRDREPRGHTRVLLESAQFFSAEFNINYSRWQGAKSTVLNEALRGAIGAREALRRMAEEINKVLVEAYPTP